ncbi:DUF6049 family protein [Actinomyces timonensis]|uniref:DUF6049 family protein n=1 Tax=Actinomyces timonensis TaxID=1288391 RepID=A0AAU8N4W8_9ACTO
MSPRRARRLLASAAAVLSSAAMIIAGPALAAPVSPAGPLAREGAQAVKVLPADHAPSAPSPTAPAITAGAITLTVDAMAPEILHSGEDLRITGTIANGTTTNLSGASIVVQAQRSTEVSTRGLSSWLAGERSTSLVTAMDEALGSDVAPGTSQRFSVTVKSFRPPPGGHRSMGPSRHPGDPGAERLNARPGPGHLAVGQRRVRGSQPRHRRHPGHRQPR